MKGLSFAIAGRKQIRKCSLNQQVESQIHFAYMNVGNRRQAETRLSLFFVMTGVSIHKPVTVVFPFLILQYLWQPLPLGVGVVPEVKKEKQENQAVRGDDVNKDGELVVAVLHEEILGDVAGHDYKLDLWSNIEGSLVMPSTRNKTKKLQR